MPVDAPRTCMPPAGLCERCRNVKIVETRKGSRFYLCTLSDVDPRFPRYPRIPVLQCIGHAPAAEPAGASTEPAEPGR